MTNTLTLGLLSWQIMLTFVAVGVAACLGGLRQYDLAMWSLTLVSAALGGAVVVFPTLVFALHWRFARLLVPEWAGVLLLLGEGLRLVGVLVMMALVAIVWSGLVWWAFLLSLILVVQAQWLQFVCPSPFGRLGSFHHN